jgi:hypothetical protein
MALDRREKLATRKLAEMEVKEVEVVDQEDGLEVDSKASVEADPHMTIATSKVDEGKEHHKKRTRSGF